ncbi:MAG TPA: alpha/beta fold hydrolase [Thermoanaerobaculia bacterium]|jgi:pimeloyl-ACP methyl ester carboxylesterase|nr:alpha/beta fold hydrolase [Thermoanaerobaculia bacterium]
MKRNAIFMILCLFLLSVAAGHAAEPRLTLSACADPTLPKGARCGTYEVFENRAAKKGRKIPLRVVVLPALGPDKLPDPVVYFAGGPGGSSVEQGIYLRKFLEPLRQRRDFLFIDARGTGGSAPLDCPELRSRPLQAFLDQSAPPDEVRACRERLSKIADLTQYTTENVVDDADEVRAALGYPQVNLIGASYGTRVELVYLRRHPDRVRTAILAGVSTTHNRLPLFVPRNTQKALDGLLAECAGDADCAQAFPHLKDELAAVLARAEREPVRVQVTDPATAKASEIRLPRDIILVALRSMLYEPSLAAELPLQVHLAAQGDWKPLAGTVVSLRQSAPRNYGFYFSVTCAEDAAFIREQDIPAAVAGTAMGGLRIRRNLELCAQWPAAKLPESFEAPVISDVPVLIVNHERDPATPASDGEEAARTLRRSRAILIPDGGHGMEGMKGQECVYGLWVKTIEDGSVDRLDASCVAKVERPAFTLRLADEPEAVAVSRADLEPLVGSYASEDGLAVEIDLLEGRLHLKIESESYLLVPTASDRFRPEGLPAGYAVRFERDGKGPATAVFLMKPGQPELKLARIASQSLVLGPCTDPNLPKDARCGTYEVFENRAAKTGRKIPLRVLVLPALGSDRQPDAVVYFPGGPGSSAVESAGYLSQSLAPLRRHRDFLLVDARGTGGSGPSTAPSFTAFHRSRDSSTTTSPPARRGPAASGWARSPTSLSTRATTPSTTSTRCRASRPGAGPRAAHRSQDGPTV